MSSYDTLPTITEGELINIQLKAARVLTVSDDRQYIQVEAPNAYRLLIDRTKVAIDRIAPKEWPPQAADVWRDSAGTAWMVFLWQNLGKTEMAPSSGGRWSDPEEVLQSFGPLRLEYRPGWRPPDPDAKSDPGEVDGPTARVVGLRALADFLEAHEELPHVYALGGQLTAESADHVQEMADQYGATIAYDDEDAVAAALRFGPVELKFHYRKPAPAFVEGFQPAAPVDGDADVDTWEHEGGARLVDDGDAIALAPCTSGMAEPGADHTHVCALAKLAGVLGGQPHEEPHPGDHICFVDGCGRGWSDNENGPALPADLGTHEDADVADRGIL